jgi:DNA-binding NtrC family response regulator
VNGANGATPHAKIEIGAMALSEAKRAASDSAERAFLERGLEQVGGTVTELARRCEMNRSHVQMLLKKHGIRSKDFRTGSREAAA